MATLITSSSLQLSSNPFSSPKRKPKPHFTFITRAATNEPEPPQPSESDPDDFDDRLAQMRLRYRSGTGKKAEIRKVKRGKRPSSASSSGAGIFLPPVPLKEPSSGGLKVDFGFGPYSEWINGRLAMFGICALLLVELGSGKSVISFHTPSVVLIQLYTVAALSALFLKFQKEKVSIWPRNSADK